MSTAVETKATEAPVEANVADAVARALGPAVIELQALAVNGKQAHWHVRGDNFISIHELLDSVVDHGREFADLAAERIVALDRPVDARIAEVAAHTSQLPLPAGFLPWRDAVTAVVAGLDATLAVVRSAIKELDGVDLASQDVAIEVERGLAKDRWFLAAHLDK